MTHEVRAGAEAENGPEHDDTLPDAELVRVYDDPAGSDGPPIADDELAGYPTWAGTERNEA